jgi:hypothetical protein
VRRARRHRGPRDAVPRRAQTRSMEVAVRGQALRISLRNGFRSARPLIRSSWRSSWGAGEGSADGRGGDSEGAQKDQGGQHQQQHRTTAKRTGRAEDGHRGRAFMRSAMEGLR